MASRAKNKTEALSSDDIGELLDELQHRVDRCKVLFEQYFLGIQRTPPSQLHVELERSFRNLTQQNIRNTRLRFRFTSLSQRFTSYNTYWKRTMRQIENGSYIRDIAKVGREAAKSGKDIPEELLAKMPKRMRDRIIKEREALAERAQRVEEREQALQESGTVRTTKPSNVHQLDEDDLLDDFDLDSIFSNMTGGSADGPSFTPTPAPESKPAISRAVPLPRPTPTRSTPPAPPPPGASGTRPPPGMSTEDAQALFKRYKKAREMVGDNTSHLSYEKLMRSLNKQAPKIIQEHNAKGVTFNVVVKGDRVIMKAKPHK